MTPILQAGLDPHTLRWAAGELLDESRRLHGIALNWHRLWLSSLRDTDLARFKTLADEALVRSAAAKRYRQLATRIENRRRK